MNDLIIFGASGFGREVAWLVERINKVSPQWNILGFLDDDDALQNTIVNGYTVIGKSEDINSYPDAYIVCAVGSSKVRKKIIDNLRCLNPDVKFGTLIDPSVEISDLVTIGEGSIICAQTVITVNICIGKFVIINLDCTVGHDVLIDDYVTLYPSVNVSGITHIRSCSEIGTGTHIIQGKEVGFNTIIGAGSVVVKNIPENCLAVGVPAAPIKENK